MSSARARNFRRRADDDDDGEENNDEPKPSTTTPATTTTKPSSKPSTKPTPKPKKPSLLSFADDEETEALNLTSRAKSSYRPNKNSLSSSSASHKLTSSKDRQKPSTTSVASNVLPQAGTYTKETLRELQKNTKTLASSSSKHEPMPEPVIVLKGLIKPVTLNESSGIKPEESGSGTEDSENEEAVDVRRGIGKIGVKGKDKDSDSYDSVIPDRATIEAIRAKRERLRQSRAAAPDYISLDGGSHHGEAEGLSDEEPEFQGRIAMFGEKVKSGKKGVFDSFDDSGVVDVSVLRRESEVVDNGGSGIVDEDDEEEKIWEEEQFRKGFGKRIDDGPGGGYSSSASSVSALPPAGLSAYSGAVPVYGAAPGVVHGPTPAPPSIGGAMGSIPGLDSMTISQQAEVARKAIQENVRRLKDTHGRTTMSLTKTDENLSASLLSIDALEKSLFAAGEKYIFMQKLRDYISVICKFLQDKAPYIEELEEQMQKINEERASAIMERRQADDEDEMVEIEAAVNAAMLVFRKGDSSAATIATATSAVQAAVAALREQKNLPVKLDEFGRDMNLQKRMDMARRAEARQQRKDRFDSKRLSSMEVDSPYCKVEGESSTDESDSESTAYQSNRELVLQTASQIFDDTAEEYAKLSEVKERFEKWKRDYSSSYRDAYMSLSIPNIFSPYVRLELLRWDPLHEEVDFFDMEWHSLLFNYGVPEDGSDFTPEDADANLVPELVEKVALPILHHEISHCWDMVSTCETRNAVSATALVINYVPASSEALAELLLAIRTRLTDAVANLVVPTWSPLVLKAVPAAGRIAAYRFGVSVRLMRNICLWKEILALPVLEKLVLDNLLCGKVLPHVRSISSDIHDAITRTERVVASLSGVWAGPSVTGNCSHKLQPLVDYVLSLGKSLQKKISFESETNGLARRLKKMLVELNEYDNARELVRTFHLKEAL